MPFAKTASANAATNRHVRVLSIFVRMANAFVPAIRAVLVAKTFVATINVFVRIIKLVRAIPTDAPMAYVHAMVHLRARVAQIPARSLFLTSRVNVEHLFSPAFLRTNTVSMGNVSVLVMRIV